MIDLSRFGIGRGAPATGGRSAQPDHPSRKHDVPVASGPVLADVEHDTSGIRRRERRAMRNVVTYRSVCACGAEAWETGIGSSTERNQEARDDWALAHQDCA